MSQNRRTAAERKSDVDERKPRRGVDVDEIYSLANDSSGSASLEEDDVSKGHSSHDKASEDDRKTFEGDFSKNHSTQGHHPSIRSKEKEASARTSGINLQENAKILARFVGEILCEVINNPVVRYALKITFGYLITVSLACMIPGLSFFPQISGVCPSQGFGMLANRIHAPLGCDVWPLKYYLKTTPHCNRITDVEIPSRGFSGFCNYYPPGALGLCSAPPDLKVIKAEDAQKAVTIMFDDMNQLQQDTKRGIEFFNRYGNAANTIFMLANEVKWSTLQNREWITDSLLDAYHLIGPLSNVMITFSADVRALVHVVEKINSHLYKAIRSANRGNDGHIDEQEERVIAEEFFKYTRMLKDYVRGARAVAVQVRLDLDHFKRIQDMVFVSAGHDNKINQDARDALALRKDQGIYTTLLDVFSKKEHQMKTLITRRDFNILQNLSRRYQHGWGAAYSALNKVHEMYSDLEGLCKIFDGHQSAFESDGIKRLVQLIQARVENMYAAP